jgi:hypothetical protein
MMKKHKGCFKKIEKLPERCSKAMQIILQQSLGNEEEFHNLVKKKVKHYCGDHTNCVNLDYCKTITCILDKKAQQAFKVF